jgi:positive regulator of sigma E activity
MVERGIVRAVSGDRAEVEICPEAPEECRTCGICDERPGGRVLVAAGGRGLAPGRLVEVEVGAVPGVAAAVVVFLVPVAALCGGALVGSRFPSWVGAGGASESGGAIAGAVIALLLALLVVRACDRGWRRRAPAARIVRAID